MCRLAAYAGPPLPLHRLLLDPPHSLYKQSYAPAEMQGAVLNADGYGFGWYDGDGRPRIYTCSQPIWADSNLQDLADSLQASLWLANVRSATPGQPVNQANTQPFRNGRILFLHNGYLEDFDAGLRQAFHRRLDPVIQAELYGNTDSEYLFALLREVLREQGNGDICAALTALSSALEPMLDGRRALLGMVVSDGERLYALRHGFNCPPPSLYACHQAPAFPNALVIASERLIPGEYWQPLPAGRVVSGRPGEALQ
jgi:gamma-glutamyl hercynylcysteine S-oxide hydrolase